MRLLLLLALATLACTPKKTGDKTTVDEPTEWISLFNGHNLEGWTIRIMGKEMNENYGQTFRVDSGMLKIRYDQYEDYGTNYGAIYYNEPFSNYRLKMQYRFVGDTASGAPVWGFRDSGVMFHCQSPQSLKADQGFPVCLEYNLHGGDGVNDRPTGQACFIGTYAEIDGKRNPTFCNDPKVSRTFHGDQWVTLEIDVRDSVVTHFVNGKEILRYTNPRLDPENDDANALIEAGNDRLTSGYIALQSNSHPIDFRSIELKKY